MNQSIEPVGQNPEPESDPQGLVAWERPEDGLTQSLEGVHLGRLTTGRFRDEAEVPVPGAGFAFRVEQASYGFTGMSARQLEGSRVEALVVDPETQAVSWSGPAPGQNDVRVTGDWGNLSKDIPWVEWTKDLSLLANPGARGGVVRVTNSQGGVKFYLLAADFQGEPDNWRVKGGVIEVKPKDAEQLAASPVAELPPAAQTTNQNAYLKPSGLPEGGISKHIDRVIESIDRSDLNPEEQSQVLADHFTGAILRTEEKHQAVLTIQAISNLAGIEAVRDETGQPVPWTRAFTRSGGLRRAILALDQHANGRRALGLKMAHTVHYENGVHPDHLVMTRMDQLTAYLETETPEEANIPGFGNATNWKRSILNELSRYFDIPTRKEAWQSADNLSSDVESVRKNQQEWERAVGIARTAGVDMDLLTRSAEYIKRNAELRPEIGRVALVKLGLNLGFLNR